MTFLGWESDRRDTTAHFLGHDKIPVSCQFDRSSRQIIAPKWRAAANLKAFWYGARFALLPRCEESSADTQLYGTNQGDHRNSPGDHLVG